MGDLIIHNLSTYQCDHFVESGTGLGVGIRHACRFPQFVKLHTIEIWPELYEKSKITIDDERCTCWLGDSREILRKILPLPGKTLFWLDGHFPGSDFGYTKHEFTEDAMPLKKELEIIKELQGDNFCAIIDDLDILLGCRFELPGAPIPKDWVAPGIDWIQKMFPRHQMQVDRRHQGFLILCA